MDGAILSVINPSLFLMVDFKEKKMPALSLTLDEPLLEIQTEVVAGLHLGAFFTEASQNTT